jgi:hypothetical protein
MIVVTLLAIPCGYVGWQAKIVDERNAMITDLRNTEKVVFGLAEPGDNDQPPWIRRILGDQGIRYIGLPITTTTTKEYRRRVRELFPEAECIGSFIIRPDNGWIVLTDFPEELSKPGRATRTAHSIYPVLAMGDHPDLRMLPATTSLITHYPRSHQRTLEPPPSRNGTCKSGRAMMGG